MRLETGLVTTPTPDVTHKLPSGNGIYPGFPLQSQSAVSSGDELLRLLVARNLHDAAS